MFIEAIYEGKSIGILNNIVSGQNIWSVNHYFIIADQIFIIGNILLAIIISIFMFSLKRHKSFMLLLIVGILSGYFIGERGIIQRCILKLTSQRSQGVMDKDGFLSLRPDGAEDTASLIVHMNGSISFPNYPYKISVLWKTDDDLWYGENEKSDFSWELLDGYLPLYIVKNDYKGISFESVSFCDSNSTLGKNSFCYKILKIENKSNENKDLFLSTKFIYDAKQQYLLSRQYEQGFDLNVTQVKQGELVEIGNSSILCNLKFDEQKLKLSPKQVITVKYQYLLDGVAEKNEEYSDWNSIEDKLTDTKDYWLHKLSDISSKFAESEDKEKMLASLVQILMAGGDVIKPTDSYSTAFIRDGGMIVHTLNLAGFYGLSRKQIDYYLDHPWASGFGPEADAPGHLVWMISDYIRASKDVDWLQKKWVKVQSNLEKIISIIDTKESYDVQGLKVAARSGSVVFGRMDGAMQPIYCNVWLLAGLREGAYLAKIVGDDLMEEKYTYIFNNYYSEFIKYCKENIVDLSSMERTFIAGVYPTQIFKENQDFVKELYRRRWPKDGRWVAGEWPYFELAQAHAYYLLGETDKSQEIYDAIKAKYPGYKYGLYYEGNVSRYMPHLWATAEAFCYYYTKLSRG